MISILSLELGALIASKRRCNVDVYNSKFDNRLTANALVKRKLLNHYFF